MAALLLCSDSNIESTLENIIRIFLLFAPLAGVVVFSLGLYDFYKASIEVRTTSAMAFWGVITGSLLISIEVFSGTVAATFIEPEMIVLSKGILSETNIHIPMLNVSNDAAAECMKKAWSGVRKFVWLIGFIGVMRGLFLMRLISNRENGSNIGTVAAHLVGGVLAMNITWIMTILAMILGIDQSVQWWNKL